MAFGMVKKTRGSPTPEKAKGVEPQRDETESTIDDDDEDNECENVPMKESKPEESIEAAFVELQHDLREKTAQCAILRETLSTMSVKMKRQECQLQEMINEVEEQIRLLEEKTIECEQWKLKYKTLQENRVDEFVAASPATNTEVYIPLNLPAIDPLLGDATLFSSFPTRRPWRPSSNEKLDELSTTEISEDSISEPHGSELDIVYSPKRSPRRSYKTKKNREIVKAFQTMPMSWLGDEKEDEPTEAIATLDEEQKEEPMEAMQAPEQEAEQPATPIAEETPEVPEEEEIVEEEETPVAQQDDDDDVASDPETVVADENKYLAMDESMLHLDDCDESAARSVSVITVVVEEGGDLRDDISLFSCSSADTVEMEFKNSTPIQITNAPNQGADSNKKTERSAKTLIDKQRARIRRMAKREARKAKFSIEKVEC